MTSWRVYDCGKTRTIEGAEVYYVIRRVTDGVEWTEKGDTIGYSDDAGYVRVPEDVGDHFVEATKDGWFGHYSGIDPHHDIHIELCSTESVVTGPPPSAEVLVRVMATAGTLPISVSVTLLDGGVEVGSDTVTITELGRYFDTRRFSILGWGDHVLVASYTAENPFGKASGQSPPRVVTL